MIYEVDKTKVTHDTWENDWYECPNCGYDCIDIGFHYCPMCGEGLNCGLFDDCEEDGEYDLSKKYRFSYKKLIKDDRIQSSSFHLSWTSSLKEYDGTIVTLIDKHEGNIDNKFSIARNWCEEII